MILHWYEEMIDIDKGWNETWGQLHLRFLLTIHNGMEVENSLVLLSYDHSHNAKYIIITCEGCQNLIIWYVEPSCVNTVEHAQVNWSVIAVYVRYELLIVFIMPPCSHDEGTPMNDSAARLMWTSYHGWKKLYSCCSHV